MKMINFKLKRVQELLTCLHEQGYSKTINGKIVFDIDDILVCNKELNDCGSRE